VLDRPLDCSPSLRSVVSPTFDSDISVEIHPRQRRRWSRESKVARVLRGGSASPLARSISQSAELHGYDPLSVSQFVQAVLTGHMEPRRVTRERVSAFEGRDRSRVLRESLAIDSASTDCLALPGNSRIRIREDAGALVATRNYAAGSDETCLPLHTRL